jgi:hypothetical protein
LVETVETGSVEKQKSSGRPETKEEILERITQPYVRSPSFSCEHSNEISGTTKFWEVLECLHN